MAARKQRKKRNAKLYRREWKQTDNPLVAEARAQTLALQRLQTWLRLAYAMVAIGVLVAYWGFAENGGMVAGVIGIVFGVIAIAITIVLRVGIDHGRKNVNAMLEQLQTTQ